MIVYHLSCTNHHGFDAWFRDSATCEEQLEGGKVVCPECGSRRVQKAIMAPRIRKGREVREAPVRERPPVPAEGQGESSTVAAGEMIKTLRELRKRIEENADYVGNRFAEEARKIHYGEVERRDIYGEASPDEASSLKDEGVEFFGIPWVPRHDS